MSSTRERFCPHCGRANPVTMPRCLNCGERIQASGALLLTQPEEPTTHGPWWQTSETSVVPPPPQVRQAQARQDAVLKERERQVEETRRFEARLAEGRRLQERPVRTEQRREARQTTATTETVAAGELTSDASSSARPVTTQKVALTNCSQCGATLGQAGQVFSFCLNCGADVKARKSEVRSSHAMTPGQGVTSVATVQTTPVQTIGQTARVQTRTFPQGQRLDINPGVPALLSFLFPGVGQFANGQTVKGVLLLLGLFVLTFLFHGVWPGLALLALRVLSAVDAYRIAERKREGQSVRVDEWDFGG